MATRTKSFEEITGKELLEATQQFKVDGDNKEVSWVE